MSIRKYQKNVQNKRKIQQEFAVSKPYGGGSVKQIIKQQSFILSTNIYWISPIAR